MKKSIAKIGLRVALTIVLYVPVAFLMVIGRIGDSFSAFGPHQHDTTVRDTLFLLITFSPACVAIWRPRRGLLIFSAIALALPTLFCLVLLVLAIFVGALPLAARGVLFFAPLGFWYWYCFYTLKKHKISGSEQD